MDEKLYNEKIIQNIFAVCDAGIISFYFLDRTSAPHVLQKLQSSNSASYFCRVFVKFSRPDIHLCIYLRMKFARIYRKANIHPHTQL